MKATLRASSKALTPSVIELFGGTMTSVAPNEDVLSLVMHHAEERPEALAVKDDLEALNYGDLARRAAQVAGGLAAAGAAPGDRVAVLLDNSAAWVTVALGCLWLGAAFVPFRAGDPPARLGRLLDNCSPRAIVTKGADELATGYSSSREAVAHVNLGALLGRAGPVPEMCEDPGADAYVIYTSGTTGGPKGVRISRRAFAHSVVTTSRLVGYDATARSLCVSAFYFDGSYGIVFPTLVAGGRLIIPRREELAFLKRFYSSVRDEEITHTSFSPTYLRLVLSTPRASGLAGTALGSLCLGGEQCMAADVAKIKELLPGLRVFNRYGPTEATVAVTSYEVSGDDLRSGRVPIGVPHPGTSFWLLKDDGSIEGTPGRVGELYIGGSQLMEGYWGDDALSRSVLVRGVDPDGPAYKTGDLAYRDEQGRYFFVGRCDDVVKRRSLRISLEELSGALRGADGVRGAVCIAADIRGELGIIAFVEADAGVTAAGLLSETSSHIPERMQPDEVHVVEVLPMSPRGKVDREELLASVGRVPWRQTGT